MGNFRNHPIPILVFSLLIFAICLLLHPSMQGLIIAAGMALSYLILIALALGNCLEMGLLVVVMSTTLSLVITVIDKNYLNEGKKIPSVFSNDPSQVLIVPKGTEVEVAELPRPNSGTFTFEQAEARKHEILANFPSKPLTTWENVLHLDFAIHVAADDSFIIYTPPGSALSEPLPTGKVSIGDIMRLRQSIVRYGRANVILITSDRPLRESESFPKLLESLFIPDIVIYYLATKQ